MSKVHYSNSAEFRHREIHFLKILLIWITSLLILSAITLAGLAYYYQDSFYPGVRAAGLNLSGVNQQVGGNILRNLASTYADHKVIVTIPDVSKPKDTLTNRYPDIEIPTTAKDLGLRVDAESAVSQAWTIGHNPNRLVWLKQVIPNLYNGQKVSMIYSIDNKLLQAFIDTKVLPQLITPVPAKVVVSGGIVQIEDPKPGSSVDSKELASRLSIALNAIDDASPTYLQAPIAETQSNITRRAVQPVADQLDSLGNLAITLTDSGKTFTPKREMLLTWFSPVQNDQGVVDLSINQDAVSGYLKSIASSVAADKLLNQTSSLAAVVSKLTPYLTPIGGSETSTNTSKNVTLALVTTVKPVETKPSVTAEPGQNTPGKFPGKYIEVNLAEQKMYLFVGETLEQTYRVSTGKWSTPTPTGIYSIHDKTPRAYSYAFGLYMPYWQDFLGGAYGIHGLPEWPNGYKEGENHLGIPVSHGCIRLGSGADVYVYNWTEAGTPVYIH